MSSVHHATCAAFVLLLPLQAAAAAHAQTVRGRVIDAASSQPVRDARVELLHADSSRAARTTTDASGRFVLTPRSGADYRLLATHVAYQPSITGVTRIGAGEEVVVDLKLTSIPIALDPLTVVARRADTRHDATPEGMYSRYRIFPPIGNRRVFLPHDPEMVSALDIPDVLNWALPPRGCRIVYWNGFLQQSEAAAAARSATAVSMLEAIEYYRHLTDAPLAYREIPAYLGECLRFHVLALWPRTDRYIVETEPHPTDAPGIWHPRVHAVAYHLRGEDAPGIGVGLELSTHQELTSRIHVGALARVTLHRLDASATQALTTPLHGLEYTLPAGPRPLQLWVIGADVRALPLERAHARITTSARIQVASRRFSLRTPIIGAEEAPVHSYGWGVGLTADTEFTLTRHITAVAGLGWDWLTFDRYERIERRNYPTAATWSAAAVRAGLTWQR